MSTLSMLYVNLKVVVVFCQYRVQVFNFDLKKPSKLLVNLKKVDLYTSSEKTACKVMVKLTPV